jgi:cleavage and polyadenylation specificity factor subunit 3
VIFSVEDERHLKIAEIPSISPDVLIIESTYGVSKNEGRIDREFRFIQSVTRIVELGGRALIPIFALGRVQELLIILLKTLSCASKNSIKFQFITVRI